MFGASPINWAITYVMNNIAYYLSEIDNTNTKLIWSTRKENSKKFLSKSEAQKLIDDMKDIRKNKKLKMDLVSI